MTDRGGLLWSGTSAKNDRHSVTWALTFTRIFYAVVHYWSSICFSYSNMEISIHMITAKYHFKTLVCLTFLLSIATGVMRYSDMLYQIHGLVWLFIYLLPCDNKRINKNSIKICCLAWIIKYCVVWVHEHWTRLCINIYNSIVAAAKELLTGWLCVYHKTPKSF